MKKEGIEFYKIDILLNRGFENAIHIELNNESIQYLKNIVEVYYEENDEEKIDKYRKMLEFAGKDSMTKICRDIRQCIMNLQRQPYNEQYDHSEEILIEDILYIDHIIKELEGK